MEYVCTKMNKLKNNRRMAMKCGTLTFDPATERLDVLLDNGSSLGGLHCGDSLDVCVDGEYRMTRIEYSDDWYLYGLFEAGSIPVGLKVRVYN